MFFFAAIRYVIHIRFKAQPNQVDYETIKMERTMQVTSNPIGFGFGCCDFQLKNDEAIICARSMEFPLPLNSQITVINRGQEFVSKAPDGSPGLKWTAKYGYVGITALQTMDPRYIPDNEPSLIDEGINEKGLSFGVLSLNCSEYQQVNDSDKDVALGILDAGNWILGSFATVDEVKEGMASVKIWGQKAPPPLNETMGLHIALHDASGKNLVIEFLKGEAVIRENPLGILTNDPPLNSHINQLVQYFSLNPDSVSEVKINDVPLEGLALSNGMNGLPGDWSSITRFVRIATAVRYAFQEKTVTDGVISAVHIMNSVDIPKGMVIANLMQHKLCETTRWRTYKDLTHKRIYYQTYEDPALHMIDLAKINFTLGTSHPYLPMQGTPTIIDETEKLS